MPDTIRQQIIDNIKSTLDAVIEFEGEAEVNAPEELDLETAALPKVFIDSNIEDENLEDMDIGHEAFSWKPIISVYFRVKGTKNNKEPETMLGILHKAMTEDRRRGGLADETKRLTADIVEVRSEYGLIQAIVTMWQIDYSHTDGDPYSQ